MVGLTEKDMNAVVRSYDLKPFYYPTLFPLKETQTLSWKMLEAQTGLKIAADLVARGATSQKKTRQAIAKIAGDIPKLMIAREMLEDELTEYDIMVAMTSANPDLRALVEVWAEDTKYCWTGIAARTEYVALKSISNGKLKFTNSNNAAVVTEYDVDYEMAADQKIGVKTSWLEGVAGKPLSVDFPKAIKAAKAKGVNVKFAFMNVDTFAAFASQDEVIKKCATVLSSLTDAQDSVDLATVNGYLAKHKEVFKGLQIIVIDQDITIELADGSQITGNPFEDNVVLFSESKVLGATWWKRPIDAKPRPGSVATIAMNGHTLIKKYSEESPVKEVTEGIANIFPAWNLAGRSILMKTDHTTWNL